MRMVIDMQGAQSTESRHRGIGRYTMGLTQAIVRNRGEHEIVLALNGLFPETIEPMRAVFHELIPQENIRVWYAPGPVHANSSGNEWHRRAAEHLREAFLASLRPDVVLVSSLVEGFGDDAVTSIGTFATDIPTAVVLYDLIPLIHRQPYLENPAIARWYLGKLDHLRRADLLLAISESTRQEGIGHLGFEDSAVANISAAASPHFVPKRIKPARKAELRKKYGLAGEFVMYTGGIDHRKNIEGLIRAYGKLPKALRENHQLAVVCSIQPHDRQRLENLGRQCGLTRDEVILSGFVPEEDLVDLYNLCTVFAFPSWHEGFGLPALEAMSCGRAVIAANTSSLPEVIGRDDALFDPHSDEDMAAKLSQVLTDAGFRQELERHGLERAKGFSWDISARRAIAALEHQHEQKATGNGQIRKSASRPKLAYLSPLPPERSGISDYSAELIAELSRHYDIEVVVAQNEVTDPFIKATCPIRTVDWFRAHAAGYDRVLYHFGNSHFHQHMFGLLEEIPGVVVLHDFFLSGVVAHRDIHGINPNGWTAELYKSHGYKAVQARFNEKDPQSVIWQYPCSLSVLQNALGLIVHSRNSLNLAKQWYPAVDDPEWAVIPLLRAARIDRDRAAARRALGFKKDGFVVCAFGLLGPTKLNHRLLDAWLKSKLAEQGDCWLIFVGENHPGDYGARLKETIRKSGAAGRIRITGWADTDTFRNYLAAADIGVQLRTLSRGETSAAVLDCMNHGLATIVNAHGSMTDLADDGVWKLPDEFPDADLVEALESLWHEPARRAKLGRRAREIVQTEHNPRACAAQYAGAIERFYHEADSGLAALPGAIAGIHGGPPGDTDLRRLASAIARSFPPRNRQRQLLVDISELVQRGARTGIQRVVRNILWEWLNNPPRGYRIEPVYAAVDQSYRYARRFTQKFLNCPAEALQDEPIDYAAGDVFFGLDFQPQVVPAQRGFYQALRRQGVRVQFIVYDLLPFVMPQYFVEGAADGFSQWLEVIGENDGAVCISKAVADELADWVMDWVIEKGPVRQRPFTIDWFHLGADVENSPPNNGLPKDAEQTLSQVKARLAFLMVGTIEPRKGYAQALDAFEQLWKTSHDVNLVIVGKRGWKVESLVERLQTHPERNKRLIWLEGISDEYLEKVYAASTCLIAASEDEGFGLPLIEAAQHKLPIIARDIAMFREVAGKYAYYFKGQDPSDIVRAVKEWQALYADEKHPKSDNMPWLTWGQSAEQLKKIIFEGNWSLHFGGEQSKSITTKDKQALGDGGDDRAENAA